MKFGGAPMARYDLSSLRVLGSVGEPINPACWWFYYEHVGNKRCNIVDTYWQTETGGIVMTPLPGCTPLKPGSCSLPFFGIEPALLDPVTGREIPHVPGEETHGVLCIKRPWPAVARTVYGNHERYMNAYLRPFPGYFNSDDGCTRDKDGFFWITGRLDDVIKPSGHRIGSAEIESALVAFPGVAEAAVVGFPHDVKGEGIACYVSLKNDTHESPELVASLRAHVRKVIGPLATPDYIVISPGLPKTRSGKLLRRVLRKIITSETDQLGDISTLQDPAVVQSLVDKVATLRI
jgi:acetyl-CoA synthetase